MGRLGTLRATSKYDTPPQSDIFEIGLEEKVGTGCVSAEEMYSTQEVNGQTLITHSQAKAKGNVNLAAAAGRLVGVAGGRDSRTGGLPAGTLCRLKLFLISPQQREYCGGTCPIM